MTLSQVRKRTKLNRLFWSGGGSTLLFSAPLQAGFELAKGTGSETFVRATTSTIIGFAAGAVAGASPILLPLASGEGGFLGARRISEGVWSTLLSDGAPIVPANVSNAGLYVDASGNFGYRALSQHINILLQNRTWEDVAWSATTMTVADDSFAGVDGLTRAATLTATAGNATIFQDLGVIASAIKSGGVWIQRKTGSGDIDLTLDGGSTWTTVTTTGLWTKVQISQTLADPDFGLRIVTSGDAVYVDYGQVEANGFLRGTTPETTGSAITVDADVLTYPNPILDAAGTAFAESSVLWSGGIGNVIIIGRDGTGLVVYAAANNSIRSLDGVNLSQSQTGTAMLNAPQGAASTWGSALTAYLNGAPDLTPAVYDGTMGAGAIGIACLNTGGNQLEGTVRFAQIFSDEKDSAGVGALPQ